MPSLQIIQVTPRLGDRVGFRYDAGKIKNPSIEVIAYQDVNGNGLPVSVWQSVYYPFNGETGIVLGGDWSPWRDRGGPAHCVANLFYWSGKGSQPQKYNWLASTSFDVL